MQALTGFPFLYYFSLIPVTASGYYNGKKIGLRSLMISPTVFVFYYVIGISVSLIMLYLGYATLINIPAIPMLYMLLGALASPLVALACYTGYRRRS